MQDVEIPLPPQLAPKEIALAIDDALNRSGLRVTLRDTLKKYPGCTHWHVKNGRDPGTLEITLWPSKYRAWFTVQSGRRAPWIEEKITELSGELERALRAV